MATCILRLPAVLERTGLSKSQIYKMLGEGTFPTPVHLSSRSVGWPSEAIDGWIASRKHQARKPELAAA
jgi:prophage regulatory protein